LEILLDKDLTLVGSKDRKGGGGVEFLFVSVQDFKGDGEVVRVADLVGQRLVQVVTE